MHSHKRWCISRTNRGRFQLTWSELMHFNFIQIVEMVICNFYPSSSVLRRFTGPLCIITAWRRYHGENLIKNLATLWYIQKTESSWK